MSEPQQLYCSDLPFDQSRIGAVAIYCSDGRFGEQFDDFLYGGLELPRYDRLAVPGGAACLAGHFAAYRDGDTLASQLEFLVSAHQLRLVILIAHEGCAFYTQRLGTSPIDLVSRQHEDLVKAAERVRGINGELVVEAYYARLDDGRVAFDRVV
jgi:hypothetical protein